MALSDGSVYAFGDDRNLQLGVRSEVLRRHFSVIYTEQHRALQLTDSTAPQALRHRLCFLSSLGVQTAFSNASKQPSEQQLLCPQ